jgi:hypothetical protein
MWIRKQNPEKMQCKNYMNMKPNRFLSASLFWKLTLWIQKGKWGSFPVICGILSGIACFPCTTITYIGLIMDMLSLGSYWHKLYFSISCHNRKDLRIRNECTLPPPTKLSSHRLSTSMPLFWSQMSFYTLHENVVTCSVMFSQLIACAAISLLNCCCLDTEPFVSKYLLLFCIVMHYRVSLLSFNTHT